MKVTSRLVVLCSLGFLLAGKMAVAMGAGQKIGIVDYDRAIKEQKEAQQIFKALEAEEIKLATWEQQAKVDFEKKMAIYKEQTPKWKEDKRKAEEAKLSTEINELQQESARRRQELSTNQQARLDELKTKNLRLAEEIGKKHNYAMIINVATLVYVSDEMKKKFDITADLIKAYNEKYKATATPAPAPAKPAAKPAPAPAPAKPAAKPAAPFAPTPQTKPRVKSSPTE